MLSCGMGAMVCTSFFVFQGQDPATALQITFAATVAGLVHSLIAHRIYQLQPCYVLGVGGRDAQLQIFHACPQQLAHSLLGCVHQVVNELFFDEY